MVSVKKFKVASRHADHYLIIKKWGSPSSFLSYKHLKLKLRVFLTGYIVVVVTSDVKKITTICLPVTGHLLDTIFVAATDNDL